MTVQQRRTQETNVRLLGWLSGLGLAVVPWVAAGVLSTVGGLLREEAWSPETTFPWLALGSFLTMLGWLVYGSVRFPGFRRAALGGAVVAVAGAGLLIGSALLLAP